MSRCLYLTPALVGIGALLTSACLEPNPNAEGGTGETNSSAATSGTSDPTTGMEGTGDTDAPPPCDPCEFAFEAVEFEADGGGFVGEVPKPDQPNTAPIALIRRYDTGKTDALGYEITWTELDTAWEFSVALTDAVEGSRVAGIAAVVGVAATPTIELLEVGQGGCAQASVPSELVVVESIERYAPAGGELLNITRTRSESGGDANLEYCVSGSEAGADINVRVLAFDPGEGPLVADSPAQLLDSGATQTVSYDSLPASADVLHMLGLWSFDETSASELGYAIECDDANAPFECSFELLDFKGGAEASVGGAIVAIP